MDAFFKLVNSTDDPSCSEANEYLAEDRVMCLQIYIKERAGYYLTYIPDAKAFTDAPETLTVLMKQRRRWMNGALFAAWRVISNTTSMISLGNNSMHPCYRSVGMILFMIYYFTNQVLQFFIVGSFFVSVKLFFTKYFAEITLQAGYFYQRQDLYDFFQGEGFATAFTLIYGSMLIFATVVSLAGPIDRAVPYFRYIGFVFSLMTISSLYGIATFLISTGFNPEE